MKETKCKICGKEVATEKLSEFDGKLICPECMINETTFCDHCGARIWVYESQGNEAINLCQECFDSYYTHCTRCDQLIYRNDVIYNHNDDPYGDPRVKGRDTAPGINTVNEMISQYKYTVKSEGTPATYIFYKEEDIHVQ